MEIKTRREIIEDGEFLTGNTTMLKLLNDKRWVAMDDVIELIKKHFSDHDVEEITCNCGVCQQYRCDLEKRDTILTELTTPMPNNKKQK